MAADEGRSTQALLHLLCGKITHRKDDALTPYYKVALITLGSNISIPARNDEFELAEKIKRKLVRRHREQDAVLFSELHRKLQGQDLLKDRWSVLYLLYRLGEENRIPRSKMSHSSAFAQGLYTGMVSTPFAHAAAGVPVTSESVPSLQSSVSIGSSGVSSIPGSFRSTDPSPMPQSLMPSVLQTPFADGTLRVAAPRTAPMGLRLMQSVDGARSYLGDSSMVGRQQEVATLNSVRGSQTPATGDRLMANNTRYELPEGVLMRDVVYVFQGIDGKYIKYDRSKEAFRIDPIAGIPNAVRKTIYKLAECGLLYNKVRKYADSRSTERAFGLVGQSFCAALHQELTEYYRLIAVLEAQLQQEEDQGVCIASNSLTLRRLAVWMCEPLVRLKTLAALVDICQEKKGGSLASCIHSYIQHGDPSIRALVRHTLAIVAQPIFSTIMRWIYDGELEDIYHEFFVASKPSVKDDKLWHDKYSLREEMIPSFLTLDQAKKILLTGKAINFLRQVCQDRTMIRNRDVVKSAETNQVESIFTQDLDGVFQKMIDTVYKETSMHLLEVLHTKYKFMEHLKAMRRYLLLGQGDFIRHLMDLLEEDLAKPAQTLFLHNLTGILETAIRATNAQYDDADILKRLDVRLLEVSPGDTGWDVFSLEYHVSGHIRTVFTPECMTMYLRVFNFLWRAKRMEYILALIWKEQMANAKRLRSLPELAPVLHQCHLIGAEMLHFVQQVQYYINFEVLECSWDELLRKVKDAEDLDQIIAAHHEFLDTITTRSLLDSHSTKILTQLRTIFDLIINFQAIQDNMYCAVKDEVVARQCYSEGKDKMSEKGKWGLTDAEEETEEQRRAEFGKKVISSTRSQLRVLAQSYQNMVQQFLSMLTGHSDISLRFLSFRLDFNEHYNAKGAKISPYRQKSHKKKT